MDGDVVTAEAGTERTLALEPHKSAPQRAREFVAETFSQWRLDRWAEQAVLITSELVTNAVRHAGTELTVRIRRARAEVTIEVADGAADQGPRVGPGEARTSGTEGAGSAGSAGSTEGTESAGSAGGGVGLVIVGRLAQAWGVEPRRDGKSVWARLAVGPNPAPNPKPKQAPGRRLALVGGGAAQGA